MSTHTSAVPDEIGLSGRHPVNVGHLVMGVAFLGLVTIWLLFETEVVLSKDLHWLLPLPWLAAGLAGLAGMTLTGRRSKRSYAAAPADDGSEL